jgi:hypothetical protein
LATASVLVTLTASALLLSPVTGFIDNDGPVAKRRTIELVDGFARRSIVTHLYKTKSFTAPGIPISNYCR